MVLGFDVLFVRTLPPTALQKRDRRRHSDLKDLPSRFQEMFYQGPPGWPRGGKTSGENPPRPLPIWPSCDGSLISMPLGHSWGLRATVPKLWGTVSRQVIQQQTTTNVVYPLMNHPQKRFTTCNYWRYPPIWDHVKWRSDILRISFPFISLPVTGVRGEQLSWRGMNKIHKSSPYLFGGSEHFLFFHHT